MNWIYLSIYVLIGSIVAFRAMVSHYAEQEDCDYEFGVLVGAAVVFAFWPPVVFLEIAWWVSRRIRNQKPKATVEEGEGK